MEKMLYGAVVEADGAYEIKDGEVYKRFIEAVGLWIYWTWIGDQFFSTGYMNGDDRQGKERLEKIVSFVSKEKEGRRVEA